MTLQELKKIKDRLEKALIIVVRKLKEEGEDVESDEFKSRLDFVKNKVLSKLEIVPEQYSQVEILSEIEQGIREAKISAHVSKQRKISYNELEEKPEQFKQENIKGLKFSQLDHKDQDHIELISSIEGLKVQNKSIAIFNQERLNIEEQLKNRLDNLFIPLKHDDLKEIYPDQHHTEKHTLESHIDSELMKQLKRLVSGGYVDDLHKHFMEELPRVVDIAGITKNDADSWYLRLDGTTTPSVNIGWGTYKITDLGDPTADQDAATKAYVDSQISGENHWDYAAGVLTPHIADSSVDIGVGSYYGDGSHLTGIITTDEKVKYDAGDPTAGYLSVKVIAGNGITLSEGDGDNENKLKISTTWLLDPVEDEWDITGGLPPDPEIGDRYISDGTDEELGWYDGYVYEWDGEEWYETIPIEGMMVWLIFALVWWVFFSGGWMEVGSGTYVPYTGATANIDLGAFNLVTTGTIGGINVTSGSDPGHTHTVYQPIDADLTAIAALGFTTTAFLKKTAANTWELDTNVYLTSISGEDHSILTNLDYASAGHTGFEPTVAKGNLTELTSAILTIGSGTGAVIGSGTTITVQLADTTHSGYLSSTDWNTFNNKIGTESDPVFSAWDKSTGISITESQISDLGSYQTANDVLTELTALTDPEADRIVWWNDTTNNFEFKDFANWDTAYGWGDHSVESYLKNLVEDLSPQLGAALDGQGHDLNNLGVVFLTEQANAEADVAGKGQIWVKTATPNQLYFTDDAGTDFQLATLTGTETFTNKTLTSPVIANIAPGANFILTQNSVVPFTSVEAGAVINTLYLKEGNVGIGTASPSQKLEVNGNIRLGSSDGDRYIYFYDTGGDDYLRWYNAWDRFEISNDLYSGSNYETNANIKSYNGVLQIGGTADSYVMGQFGLGDTTPSYILEVVAGSATDPIADAWNVHPSSRKVKDILSVVNPQGYIDSIRNIELYKYKRKAIPSDKVLKQALIEELKTTFSVRDWTQVTEKEKELLIGKMSPEKKNIIKNKIESELAILPKYLAERTGIMIDDPNIPDDILVKDKFGEKKGIDLLGYIGYLHATLKELIIRIDNLVQA